MTFARACGDPIISKLPAPVVQYPLAHCRLVPHADPFARVPGGDAQPADTGAQVAAAV
jgi:hypothetical protein